MQEGSLEELFKYITDETGYIANLKAEETEEAEGRIENINELLNKVVAHTPLSQMYAEYCMPSISRANLSGGGVVTENSDFVFFLVFSGQSGRY